MARTIHTPPILPPQLPADPINPTDQSTFDRWMSLPEDDLRTIEEYAENPIHHYDGSSDAPDIPRHIRPPIPPRNIIVGSNVRYAHPLESGTLKDSFKRSHVHDAGCAAQNCGVSQEEWLTLRQRFGLLSGEQWLNEHPDYIYSNDGDE